MADDRTIIAQTPVAKDLSDNPHAPIIVFDVTATQGTYNGMILVTLAAVRQLPGEGTKVENHPVVTAYLRTSIAGALALKASLEQAVAMAMSSKPAETSTN